MLPGVNGTYSSIVIPAQAGSQLEKDEFLFWIPDCDRHGWRKCWERRSSFQCAGMTAKHCRTDALMLR
jgi:hypothetical protein